MRDGVATIRELVATNRVAEPAARLEQLVILGHLLLEARRSARRRLEAARTTR